MNCLIASDHDAFFDATAAALAAVDVTAVGIGSPHPFDVTAAVLPTTFDGIEAGIRRAVASVGPIASIIVDLTAPPDPPDAADPHWRQLIRAHAAVDQHIVTHAGWARAAARTALAADHPMRVVHINTVRTAAQDTAAQSVAQLARSALASEVAVPYTGFSISYEGHSTADLAVLGQLCARLVAADDAVGLGGSELVVAAGWVGIRSHPGPVATFSYGGPSIPDAVWEPLQEAITGRRPPTGASLA